MSQLRVQKRIRVMKMQVDLLLFAVADERNQFSMSLSWR
jgi:hypothetical protein